MSDDLKKIEEAQKKLQDMEADVKKQADEADKKLAKLHELETKVNKKQEDLEKKLGITDSSAVFDTMVSTVNNLYTSYYAMRGTDEGLVEAIQSILTARKSLTSN